MGLSPYLDELYLFFAAPASRRAAAIAKPRGPVSRDSAGRGRSIRDSMLPGVRAVVKCLSEKGLHFLPAEAEPSKTRNFRDISGFYLKWPTFLVH